MVADEEEDRREAQGNHKNRRGSGEGSFSDAGSISKSMDDMYQDDRPMSFHLAVSDIHDQEIRKLRFRKYVMHVILSLIGGYVVYMYFFYYVKACSDREYYVSTIEAWE